MIIYVIRHPQTEWNRDKRLQGHRDSPLTELGQSTARKLGNALKEKNITKIISSDLGRCVETAEIVAEIVGKPTECTAELRERNFGIYEGQKVVAVLAQYDLDNPDLTPPGGENLKQFHLRIHSYLTCLYGENKNETVLLVTHHGVVRSLLALAQNCDSTDPRCQTTMDTVCQFEMTETGLNLLSFWVAETQG